MPAPPASPPSWSLPTGRIAARGYQEFAQHFPKPGWVEHSPEEIWQATLEATRAVLKVDAGRADRGRHHQPARDDPALGPRDARLSPARDRLAGPAYGRHLHPPARRRPRGPGHRADRPPARPLLLGHQADVAGRARTAHLGAGPVRPVRRRHGRLLPDRPDDARHVARHRRVQRQPHAAVRPDHGDWSDELCEPLRRTPRRPARPRAELGRGRRHRPAGRSSGWSCRSPGIAGDQQSALFGQTCFDVGDSKCTYGTGSFILTNTGSTARAVPTPACSRTAAWRSPDGVLTYALEGAIFVTGAAVQWLRDGLQIVGSAAETAAIAATVSTTPRAWCSCPPSPASAHRTGTRTPAG